MVLVRRIFWISAVVLLFAAVVYRIAWSANAPGQGAGMGVVYSMAVVLAVAFLGLLLGLFAAALPPHRQRYARRLWLRLPFVLFIACGLGGLAAVFPEWYEARHGMEPLRGATYGTVTTASAEDCLSVHDGVFGNEGLHIERQGAEQYQRDKVLGEEERLVVTWLSPCEYELRVKDPTLTRRVKILHVDSAGYDCVVRFGDDSTYAYTMRLDRVR